MDDQKTLQESGIKDGVKILMIGSKTYDVQALNANKPEPYRAAIKEKATKEPLCQQKVVLLFSSLLKKGDNYYYFKNTRYTAKYWTKVYQSLLHLAG